MWDFSGGPLHKFDPDFPKSMGKPRFVPVQKDSGIRNLQPNNNKNEPWGTIKTARLIFNKLKVVAQFIRCMKYYPQLKYYPLSLVLFLHTWEQKNVNIEGQEAAKGR